MRWPVAFVPCAALLCVAEVFGGEDCRDDRAITTPFGALVIKACSDAGRSREYSVSVDQRVVLRDAYLSRQDRNPDRSVWIFRGRADVETGCARAHYLVDLSMKPIRVTAFGVKTACNEFDWSSWGGKRSVIALKNNVRFVYQDGKLMPPVAGPRLFNSIEPPHSSIGEGMTEESAVPFVELIPPPR